LPIAASPGSGELALGGVASRLDAVASQRWERPAAPGVACVAVATGPFAADALQGANAVAQDARELLGLLDALRPARD